MFRIAHISDIHIPPLPRLRMRQLASKRLLGLFSWHRKWKSEHRQIVLDALLAHLQELKPDHICVTGDITYTTLPEEVDTAAAWFSRLGDTRRISLIPGNHDAYVPGALDYACTRWTEWMRDDEGGSGFPYLHRRGPVDIIGLSSAVATMPALSSGRIGSVQLGRTRALLTRLRKDQRTTLLMIHHPPQDGAASPLRSLTDRKQLQALLAECPVDLVLHGHLHYPTRAVLPGPPVPIPVLGAASASAIGFRKSAAHYHIIEMETTAGTMHMRVQHYLFDRISGKFSLSCEEKL